MLSFPPFFPGREKPERFEGFECLGPEFVTAGILFTADCLDRPDQFLPTSTAGTF
ncbi:MAG: hypothetical protein OXD01_12365 [Gammaproteobacteria bacterium]|nr:hypothetical protein [Gammaproteobacteria bacterium]